MEKIDQLGIKLLDDGGVQLEQDIGCGEVTSVYLHPIHIRYLFEKVGYLVPDLPNESVRIATLQRRMSLMRDQFYGLSPSDIFNREGGELGFVSWLRTSRAIADEFCEDFIETAMTRRVDGGQADDVSASIVKTPASTGNAQHTLNLEQGK